MLPPQSPLALSPCLSSSVLLSTRPTLFTPPSSSLSLQATSRPPTLRLRLLPHRLRSTGATGSRRQALLSSLRVTAGPPPGLLPGPSLCRLPLHLPSRTRLLPPTRLPPTLLPRSRPQPTPLPRHPLPLLTRRRRLPTSPPHPALRQLLLLHLLPMPTPSQLTTRAPLHTTTTSTVTTTRRLPFLGTTRSLRLPRRLVTLAITLT